MGGLTKHAKTPEIPFKQLEILVLYKLIPKTYDESSFLKSKLCTHIKVCIVAKGVETADEQSSIFIQRSQKILNSTQ